MVDTVYVLLGGYRTVDQYWQEEGMLDQQCRGPLVVGVSQLYNVMRDYQHYDNNANQYHLFVVNSVYDQFYQNDKN